MMMEHTRKRYDQLRLSNTGTCELKEAAESQKQVTRGKPLWRFSLHRHGRDAEGPGLCIYMYTVSDY